MSEAAITPRPPDPGRAGAAGQAAGGPPAAADLLTSPYERLSLTDRAAALVRARDAGKAMAEGAGSLSALESPPPHIYFDLLVVPAAKAGRLQDEDVGRWKRLTDEGKALRDPRVPAFLFGWHERATEILAEVAAGDEGDPTRARWFIDSLKP